MSIYTCSESLSVAGVDRYWPNCRISSVPHRGGNGHPSLSVWVSHRCLIGTCLGFSVSSVSVSQSVAHRYVSASADSSGSNSHRYRGPSVSATVSRCYRYRYLAAIDFNGCSILCVVVVGLFLLGCTHQAYCRELKSISGYYVDAYCCA